MKKLHMQERAVEEVKLAIKPFYQKREVTKDEYKDILRKAVQKVGVGGWAPRPAALSSGRVCAVSHGHGLSGRGSSLGLCSQRPFLSSCHRSSSEE